MQKKLITQKHQKRFNFLVFNTEHFLFRIINIYLKKQVVQLTQTFLLQTTDNEKLRFKISYKNVRPKGKVYMFLDQNDPDFESTIKKKIRV